MITKQSLYKIIFENDTKPGKQFDVVLLWTILVSIVVVMLDSIPSINDQFKAEFYILEWIFTLLFSLEYGFRIFVSPKPFKYIFSFWGFVDLLSILPTYLSLFLYGYQYLLIVRIIRLLRVFRILKLIRFTKEAQFLINALKGSSYKIGIFLATVITITVILGTLMYVVENGENGFSSIPQSIYWAIVTITTVGYGDITPQTVLGKFFASIAMIIGYAILAVPTGIITLEMTKSNEPKTSCQKCGFKNPEDANFCSSCGIKIKEKVG